MTDSNIFSSIFWDATGGGAGGDMLSTNNLSDVADVPTSRTNLGLGDLAVLDTVGTTELSATGTNDATTYLRGDNTWAVPSPSYADSEVVTAYLSGANQALDGQTWTLVDFVATSNYGAWFNNTTHRFTPTEAGYYNVSCQLRIVSPGSVSPRRARIQKNDTIAVAEAQNEPPNDNYAVNTQMTASAVYMNGTTDYIEIRAYTGSSGSGFYIQDQDYTTWLNIYRIGT